MIWKCITKIYKKKYIKIYTATGSLNFPTCWIWYIRSPPPINSITKYKRSWSIFFSLDFLLINNSFSHPIRLFDLKNHELFWEAKGKYKFHTIVWKQEWRVTKNGDLSGKAKTLFSVMVHSTSSSCTMISFFKILMANNSLVTLCSPKSTWNYRISCTKAFRNIQNKSVSISWRILCKKLFQSFSEIKI